MTKKVVGKVGSVFVGFADLIVLSLKLLGELWEEHLARSN